MKDLNYNQVIIDSHTHFYDSWDISLDHFLSITFNNLASYVSPEARSTTLAIVCILDTPRSPEPIIETLGSQNQITHSKWKISPAEREPFAYWATNGDETLLIIAGIQVNSYEGLEVLLIGNAPAINGEGKMSEILKHQNPQLLTILPWAVGKWLGKRGKIVSECIKNSQFKGLTLGDNGGRPKIWNRVRQFSEAYQNNITLLSGSDPLPISKGYLNSGSYGNVFQVKVDVLTPWSSILSAINSREISRYGNLSTLISFITDQIKLRL